MVRTWLMLPIVFALCCATTLSLVGMVSADIPVHCLIDQVYGAWNIHVTADGQTKSIDCSDAKSQIYGSDDFGLGKLKHPVVATWTLNLSYPNKATLTKDDGMMFGGTFTMIYDEGWEVRLENGLTFFAFSRYSDSNGVSKSYCNETFAGHMHDFHDPDGATWRCWQGTKQSELHYPASSLLSVTSSRTKRLKTHHVDVMRRYQTESALIDLINSNPQHFTHTAIAYPEFHGKSMAEIYAMVGKMRFKKPSVFSRANRLFSKASDMLMFDSALQLASSSTSTVWMGESTKLSLGLQLTDDNRIKLNDGDKLPERLDWRNHNGKNFLIDPLNQGGCGSCFAVATAAALSARLRIKYGKMLKDSNSLSLSPQQILDCDMYSQGCVGGFPLLVYRYAHAFGIVEETKNPYVGRDNRCSVLSDDAIMRVRDYGYIGGYYGASNAHAMMHALLDGPISVGLQAPPELFSYKSGVLRNVTHPQMYDARSKVLLNDWEPVNHAVVIVGYDQDEKGPYWIALNSWGSMWGDNGFFKLERGSDFAAVESLATWGDAELTNKDLLQ